MGARAWDAGPLENAAATEALTSALIAVCRNHGLRNAGIQIIGQPWTTPKDRRADST
jgi:predicted dinucleotide-binding enzyme